jgi:L-cysteine:1D-myo-inositol 2-amino-2-deoxy-alpha-D-glucopyranoside ligase
VCGITPYDATHIGHAATYVAFDLLGRAWRDAGLAVTYASNVTDVDDPLLERATSLGIDWRELAADQTALFAEDMSALGVVPPDVYLGAVETVEPVARAVEALVAQGAAYRVPLEDGAGGLSPELGDVYADVSADPSFGQVARQDRATMLELFRERGGDPDRAGKRDALDPLLWRRERAGEPAWDGGSLGTGRPGWHIECAVIARGALGLPFDVQGGGSDLLFPHHEMSTSHARLLGDGDVHGAGASTHVHAGLVAYEGEKMSKSRGNLVFVSRLRAQGVEPMAIRLALLAHHYRSDWEWTDADLSEGARRYETWRSAVSGNGGPDATATLAAIRAALADDLDAPAALAAVDEWAKLSLAGSGETLEGAPGVMARAVNSLLGVRL